MMRLATLTQSSDDLVRPKCVQPPLDLGTRVVSASGSSADDIVHFVRTRLHIEPDEKQSEFLRSTAKRIVVNCCRQWGKSMISAAKVVHRVYTHPGSQVVVAPAASVRPTNGWPTRETCSAS